MTSTVWTKLGSAPGAMTLEVFTAGECIFRLTVAEPKQTTDGMIKIGPIQVKKPKVKK